MSGADRRRDWARDAAAERLSGRALRLAWWIGTAAPARGFAVHLRVPEATVAALGGERQVRRALAELYALGWIAPVTAAGRDRPDTWVRLTRPAAEAVAA